MSRLDDGVAVAVGSVADVTVSVTVDVTVTVGVGVGGGMVEFTCSHDRTGYILHNTQATICCCPA